MRAASETKAASLAAAALGIALAASCASGPSASPSGGAAPEVARAGVPIPGPQAAGARNATGAAASSGRPAAAPPLEMDGYFKVAFAEYRGETLPNGAALAVKRQAGRPGAAATIALARERGEDASRAGYESLALAAAARSLQVRGLTFRLGSEGWDEVLVELSCPAERMAEALALFAKALASPAERDFESAVREARLAERRAAGDPFVLARAALSSARRRGGPPAAPPYGTAATLAAATRESVMRYWSERFSASRLSVAVVGDFEPATLASALAPAFGALPGGAARPAPRAASAAPEGAPAVRLAAVGVPGMPGRALLREELGPLDASSPDYPATLVALAALEDLLAAAPGGAKTRVAAAASPPIALSLYWTADPAATMAAAEAAAAELAAGRCLDPGSQGRDAGSAGRASLAACLEAYRARALAAFYAGGASSEGMATRIALDLAAGGDGAATFRMSSRLRAVRAEDVSRAAAARLLGAGRAWLALGDPAIVSGFGSAANRPLPAK